MVMMATWCLVFFCVAVTLHAVTYVTIITDKNINGPIIPDEYISISHGYTGGFDFNSTKANTLAKGLSPAFMRIPAGGDHKYYNTTGNMSQISDEFDFSNGNGWKTVYQLNALDRFSSNNSWNYTNSEELIDKIIEKNKNGEVYYYELGNEPDYYPEHNEDNVTAQQLAEDYFTLYNILQNKYGAANLDIPGIFGCDTAGPTFHNNLYLANFLKNINPINHILNGITVHHYYGSNIQYNTTNDFINVTVLDSLITILNETIAVCRINYIDNTIPIIWGETAMSYYGGTPNISSSYVDGFSWLDKLGLSAIYGITSCFRQTFYGGNYALISKNYEPNPDYWSSYLFKNLVGNKVLTVDGQWQYGRYIRTYAFCTKLQKDASIYNYPSGSITILILNLYNESQIINFKFIGIDIDTQNGYYDAYHLTSYPNVINSQAIFLNDQLIKMVNDYTLPQLKPITNIDLKTNITMKPLSYSFIVAVNINATSCL